MSQPSNEQISARIYEPTQEGFGLALDDTIAQHLESVVHTETARGDLYGQTGGDKLTLYPDPENSHKSITISPVGMNADTRRFSAGNVTGLHVVYNNGKNDPRNGSYRVYGMPGARRVDQWHANPELPNTIAPTLPEPEAYTGLIEVLTRASTEKPVRSSNRVVRTLGALSFRSK